jgi:thiosulfate/3-mercaptopyruvate sulfurtransferase
MMKVFGHNPHQLYILDGGASAWEKYMGKTESGKSTVSPKPYTAKFQPQYITTLTDIKENLKIPHEQVVDVRHPVRYAGGAEPRSNMRSGHIPGSKSFPYTALYDKDGRFHPLDKIRRLLPSVAIDLKSPIVATCGSGITAPVLDFVLDLLNHKQHSVYAGSWAEWGSQKLYPGETSLDERPVQTSVENDEPSKIND